MIRLPLPELRVGHYPLDEPSARYLLKVHRLKAGARLEVFCPEAELIGQAILSSDRLQAPALEIESVSPCSQVLPQLSLLLCVGKNDKPEDAVRDATVYGAKALYFAQSERSVAKAQGSARGDRWQRVALACARQSERANLPALHAPTPLTERLAELAPQYDLKLVCAWREDALPYLARLESFAWQGSVLVLIGPEGGLAESEIDQAIELGFEPVSLGPLVLRTEAAVSATLAAAQLSHAAHSLRQG